MSDAPDPYRGVACSFTDRLEDASVRRARIRLAWRDGAETREAETTIDDVMTEHGADWVRLGTGDVVRADRIVWLTDAD